MSGLRAELTADLHAAGPAVPPGLATAGRPAALSAAPRWRIAYLPDETLDNAYTQRMREILATFGEVERYDGVKAGLQRLLRRQPRRYDLLVANWIENSLLDHRSGRIAPGAALKLFVRSWLMRRSAHMTVFVRHNNYPHATRPASRHLAERLVDLLERLFDLVITHSGAESAAGRRHYCPHPLYRRVEPEVAEAAAGPDVRAALVLPPRYFLVFGRLVPHKRLEALIEAFPGNHNLVVAGAIGDAAYAERLLGMQRRNCFVRPGFLGEMRAQQLVSAAEGVVISHAEADVVVSGTFFYALSVGRPVYAVATPFLRWVKPRIDASLLHLADDLDGLCELIRVARPAVVPPAAQAGVEREFGDLAVHRALAAAFSMEVR